jgi:hypothetical protein
MLPSGDYALKRRGGNVVRLLSWREVMPVTRRPSFRLWHKAAAVPNLNSKPLMPSGPSFHGLFGHTLNKIVEFQWKLLRNCILMLVVFVGIGSTFVILKEISLNYRFDSGHDSIILMHSQSTSIESHYLPLCNGIINFCRPWQNWAAAMECRKIHVVVFPTSLALHSTCDLTSCLVSVCTAWWNCAGGRTFLVPNMANPDRIWSKP